MTATPSDGSPGNDAETASDGERGVERFYADVPNRLIGYLVDAILLTVLAFVGAVALSLLFGPVVTIDLNADPNVSVDTGLAFADAVLSTVIGAVYFAGSWMRFRGSPGHRLLGMRIGGEDGERISLRQGLMRWAFIGLPLGAQAMASLALDGLVDAVLLLVLFVWYLVLAIGTARDPRKQGLHDRVAGTVVTKAASPVLAAGAPAGDPRVR